MNKHIDCKLITLNFNVITLKDLLIFTSNSRYLIPFLWDTGDKLHAFAKAYKE
ncbi:hypothetical protein [uncultured Dokdonia sp.]|uniref:hypothetical protein n=1 Tax=uncultured Dokdonia sp. TaxID=575653 RepID=UPI0026173D31|nr:hypothetical protein [uncultured Dokdonia sp.]